MEYVCTGATLKCTMGTSCPKLKATPKNVSLTGKDQANIADYVSMKNIPGFGRCRSLGYPPTASATAANHGKLTPMPCVPGTCPKWKAIDKDSLICGEPALLKPATLRCMYGGTISIVNPGQTLEIKNRAVSQSSESEEKIEQEIPEELLQEFNELDTKGLDKESVLDGVQIALDAAGMVPVLGAIPDLINASISVLRGDWVGAGLSIVAAVPGVGDVVGGAKIAYKGAKIAGKATAKSVKTGKVVAKSHSNVVSIDSYKPSAKRSNKTVNPSDTKSGNVVHQNFDDLSKRRAKNASIERQVEMKKVANSKYDGKYEYGSSTKNTTTNSIDKIGSSSSSSTGTYRANPGSVVQESTNTPRFGSATSKRFSGNNHETGEPGDLIDLKKYKQEKGKNPFDDNLSSIEQPKSLELTKKQSASAKTAPKSEKGDQWEIEKEQTWDNVKKSQEQSSWNPFTIKEEPNISRTKVDNSIPKGYSSPGDVLKDNKMNKYGNFKPKPEYEQKQMNNGQSKSIIDFKA